MQLAVGKISFTTDLWDSQTRATFLALTAHWLGPDKDKRLTFHSALIGFPRVYGSHTGKNIAAVIFALIERANIQPKQVRFQTAFSSMPH